MAESDRSPDRPGIVLKKRYELLDVIGQGGHGLVWRAHDKRDDRLVAVKMLSDVAAKDPQQIERLRREQLAMQELAGTSAVGFVDLCSTKGGKLCLVMELLDGIDLEQRLERLENAGQRLPLPDLVKAFEPIVATLERAHAAGILHRDLKPANVFLMSDSVGGGVRLLDFGLARLRSAAPLTQAGTIVGSPSYIAPEVWKGRPDGLDQRVDVYSFGVCVFRALAGRLPFEGDSLQDKFRSATTAPRPQLTAFRADLSPDVDDWVQEVLAIEPDQRFHTIRGAWNALLSSLKLPVLEATAPLPLPTMVDVDDAPRASQAPTPPRGIVAAWRAATDAVRRWVHPTGSATDDAGGEPELSEPIARSEPVPEPAAAPAPPKAAVTIAPVLAVSGNPSERARGEKSFVREWLAGTELSVADDPMPDIFPAAPRPSKLAAKKNERRAKKKKQPAKPKRGAKRAPAKPKQAKPKPKSKQPAKASSKRAAKAGKKTSPKKRGKKR